MSMYVYPDFKTKKALKEAVNAGKQVSYYQPGPFGGNETKDGTIYIEGPHGYHTWYASARVKDGVILPNSVK